MSQKREHRTQDQRQELRTIAKLNEQTQDLKKSINVFNTGTGVPNPFLNNNSQSQSQPTQGTSNAPTTGSDTAPKE